MAEISGLSEDDVDVLVDEFERIIRDSIRRVARVTVEQLRPAVVASTHVFHLPGKHNQLSHGRGGRTGQAALNAVPAKLTPAPRAHYGRHEGATLTGPPGIGSADALSEYEGVEYQRTNQTLRGAYGGDDLPWQAEVDARVADIDQTMSVSRLTDDVIVERGVSDGRHVFGDAWHEGVINKGTKDLDEQDAEYDRWEAGARPNLTGTRWTEKAYVSTSAETDVAEAFVESRVRFQRETGRVGYDGEPVVMRIHVPQGTGAVELSPLGVFDERGRKMSAAEILLERGLDMEIIADHGVDDGGIRRLDVQVIV